MQLLPYHPAVRLRECAKSGHPPESQLAFCDVIDGVCEKVTRIHLHIGEAVSVYDWRTLSSVVERIVLGAVAAALLPVVLHRCGKGTTRYLRDNDRPFRFV